MPVLTPATRQAILIWLLLCALTVLITYGDAGRDGMPIVEAGRLLQTGIQPFSEAGQDVIKARFDAPGRTRCDQCALVGLVYPGTAIVVALPLSLLPSPFGEYLLAFLGLGAVVLALHLHQINVFYALVYLPPFSAALVNNPILLASGLLMLGVWLVEQRRWGWLAPCLVVALALKPHSVILIAGWLGWLALRRGRLAGVLPTVVLGVAVLLLSLVLMPNWIADWSAQARFYRDFIWNEIGGMAFFWFMLPFAGLLLILRQPLAGVVLAQASLPGFAMAYTYSPLMIGLLPYRRRSYAIWASRLMAIGGGTIMLVGHKNALFVLTCIIIPYTLVVFSPILERWYARVQAQPAPKQPQSSL